MTTTTKKQEEKDSKSMLVFDGPAYYENGSFVKGQFVALDETSFGSSDVEALIAARTAHYATKAEMAQYEKTAATMYNPSGIPLDQTDIVIASRRGVDLAFPDPREKGPAEGSTRRASAQNTLAMQQWDENPSAHERVVTRLPINDQPTGTPLAIYEAAEKSKIASSEIKVGPSEAESANMSASQKAQEDEKKAAASAAAKNK